MIKSAPVWLMGAALLTAGSIAMAQVPPPPPLPAEPTSVAPPARSPYPTCQPPNAGEYLLLVVGTALEGQDKLRRVLPATATTTVCSYLNDVVTRVGGFSTLDSANAWAQYLNETTGLNAIVARPSRATPTPTPSAAATPSPAAQPRDRRSAPFNPRPLGTGYAVLVDFFSQPELAGQVRQALGKEIGLVSYRQRPYLLAIYTTDQTAANAALQTLTDRGFWAMVVDSRRVTLLRQAVGG